MTNPCLYCHRPVTDDIKRLPMTDGFGRVTLRIEPTEPCKKCAVKFQECVPGDKPFSFKLTNPSYCSHCGRSLK